MKIVVQMPPPKKKSNSSGDNHNSGGADWLASLARQSTASDAQSSSARRKGNAKGATPQTSTSSFPATTKAERIQRREQKKRQRDERKRVTEEARNAKNTLLKQKKMRRSNNDRNDTEQTPPYLSSPQIMEDASRKRKLNRRNMTALSERALLKLSNSVQSFAQHDNDAITTQHLRTQGKVEKHKPSIQSDTNEAAKQPPIFINGVQADLKGKATKSSTLRPDSKELQPRIRDYNGQGLVRPSLFLPLNDPSFVPKLELEFAEHIPGFFGKAKTKAAKKQSDENMLWRRCLKAREEGEMGGNDSGGGKKKKKKSGGSIIRQQHVIV